MLMAMLLFSILPSLPFPGASAVRTISYIPCSLPTEDAGPAFVEADRKAFEERGWRYLRIILILLALMVIGYGGLHNWSFVFVNDELRKALSVLFPLLLAPLATVPLTMQWARHR